jgi:hypothetical protein
MASHQARQSTRTRCSRRASVRRLPGSGASTGIHESGGTLPRWSVDPGPEFGTERADAFLIIEVAHPKRNPPAGTLPRESNGSEAGRNRMRDSLPATVRHDRIGRMSGDKRWRWFTNKGTEAFGAPLPSVHKLTKGDA